MVRKGLSEGTVFSNSSRLSDRRRSKRQVAERSVAEERRAVRMARLQAQRSTSDRSKCLVIAEHHLVFRSHWPTSVPRADSPGRHRLGASPWAASMSRKSPHLLRLSKLAPSNAHDQLRWRMPRKGQQATAGALRSSSHLPEKIFSARLPEYLSIASPNAPVPMYLNINHPGDFRS